MKKIINGIVIKSYIPNFNLKIKLTYVLLLFCLSVSYANSSFNKIDDINKVEQDFTLNGIVRDSNGQPLPGASIVEKGTKNGTQSDFDGKFTINLSSENAVLVVSYLGFKTKEVTVNNQSKVTIILQEDASGLNEVVVIGYGSVRKSDLTGAVSTISSEEMTKGMATSATRAIQGKAAGVRVNQKTGRPGDGIIIRIRGGNSLSGGNEPLYVVDGFPIENLGADFNPEDIASLEILKDASATAIYGSRGANGVVLITTKRGKDGVVSIDYHGYVGVQSLRKSIDMLNRNDYAAMQNEIATKEGGSVLSASEIAALPDNNWQDLAYRTALVESHQVSASGGSDKVKFYSSLNYLSQEGILKGSDFNRIGLRLNGEVKPNDKLNIRASIGLSSTIDNNSNFSADGYGGIPFQALVFAPTTPILDDQGNYTKFMGTPWGGTNPVGYPKFDKNQTNTTRVISNVDVDYKITKDLVFRITNGLDATYGTTDAYAKIGISNGGPTNGQASKNMNKSYAFVNENLLTYTKDFNEDNRLSAMGGISYQKNSVDWLNSGRYTGFVSDIFENNNLQSAIKTVPASTGRSESTLISYIGRLNYALNDRYLFTATGRYDGSSKFGENNKYAFFPSAALAWKVSKEKFMEGISFINNLKLRTSIGSAGSQAIAPYQSLDKLRTTTAVFGSGQQVGFVGSSFSNQDLRWETTTQTDIGLDLDVYENRFHLTLDYYSKDTKNLLYNATLPPSSGYSSSIRNVGEIQNKGFEFELAYRNLEGAVKWNSSLNMSFNRSKVVDLGKDNNGNIIEKVDSPIGGGNWFPLFLNQSPSQLYGYVLDGIYQTDAEAASIEPGKHAGDYRIKDISNDGIINGDDKKRLTHMEPKAIFGMQNEFSYKNFNLSFLIVGSYGNDIVNEFNKYYTAMGGTWNVTQKAYDNRWTGPGSTGTYAAASSGAPGYITFGEPSTLWVEDGSYLRLKDIKIAYSLPDSVTKQLKINSATFYISGTNLLTLTNYLHYDPEASWTSSAVNGWDRGVYPSSKSISAGVNLKF